MSDCLLTSWLSGRHRSSRSLSVRVRRVRREYGGRNVDPLVEFLETCAEAVVETTFVDLKFVQHFADYSEILEQKKSVVKRE